MCIPLEQYLSQYFYVISHMKVKKFTILKRLSRGLTQTLAPPLVIGLPLL